MCDFLHYSRRDDVAIFSQHRSPALSPPWLLNILERRKFESHWGLFQKSSRNYLWSTFDRNFPRKLEKIFNLLHGHKLGMKKLILMASSRNPVTPKPLKKTFASGG